MDREAHARLSARSACSRVDLSSQALFFQMLDTIHFRVSAHCKDSSERSLTRVFCLPPTIALRDFYGPATHDHTAILQMNLYGSNGEASCVRIKLNIGTTLLYFARNKIDSAYWKRLPISHRQWDDFALGHLPGNTFVSEGLWVLPIPVSSLNVLLTEGTHIDDGETT